MTQVLMGHGCFGEYLCRIGKERTTECHHCGHPRDSAQHTLEECLAWAAEHGELMAAVGADLSLPAVLAAAVGSEEAWKKLSSFCGKVMLPSQPAERWGHASAGWGSLLKAETPKPPLPSPKY
ncbi:Reverse transcriptase [Camponotus japonicus]